MTNMRPNFFADATELTQDAFIAWLASWVNCDEDPELQRHAKDFVAMLINSSPDGTTVDSCDINAVEAKRQVEKIDVLLIVTVADQKLLVVIEDKTFTQHKKGQLVEHVRAAKELQKSPEKWGLGSAPNRIVYVYYKTGYLFYGKEDLAPKSHAFGIIDFKKLNDFFSRTSSNIIFCDYAQNLSERADGIAANIKGLFEEGKLDCFLHSYTQWEFMLNLREKLSGKDFKLHRGTERGGKHFTELRFRHSGLILNELSEKLMYRIERRKGVWRLVLGQFAQLSRLKDKGVDVTAERKAKVKRLKSFVMAYEAALATAEGSLLWKGPRQDKKGANLSKIGILEFDSETNTVARVLEHLPKFHESFCAALDG